MWWPSTRLARRAACRRLPSLVGLNDPDEIDAVGIPVAALSAKVRVTVGGSAGARVAPPTSLISMMFWPAGPTRRMSRSMRAVCVRLPSWTVTCEVNVPVPLTVMCDGYGVDGPALGTVIGPVLHH